ncbi:NAD(P)-dependent oxidoreductase [Propioniciclava soli]|uniref:NAD(P)-dependent oxidoreductase n=1 Tax=Propioniciclava soli TaxID=2775081 RepID=UPI001E474693|nr:NAD(P)-dependent oxidoreductase [Propioniciclava soli]
MAATGFIGLGVMGRPMARHVMASGRPVVLHTRTRSRVADLETAGAGWADTPAELARRCSVIVFVPPTIADIRAVTFGADGVLAGALSPAPGGDAPADAAGPPLLLVVSSTCGAAEVRTFGEEVRAASRGRVTVVDAPVSGGAEGAEAGTLSVMVGGADADAARAVEVLGATGRAVHLGPLGAGQVAKACNQLIVAATVVANAEAAVVAERAGLDVAALFDLLGGGYAGSRVMEVKARRFAEHDHSPSGAAKFMVKDLRAFAEVAADTGTTTTLTEPLRDAFGGLTDAGLGDADTAVVQHWIELASDRA